MDVRGRVAGPEAEMTLTEEQLRYFEKRLHEERERVLRIIRTADEMREGTETERAGDITDPLLGRHNVVHTPHNAGRTRQANEAWAAKLVEQFEPVG